MAILKDDSERSPFNSYYRPSVDDFTSILDRLRARRLQSTLEFSISPTCLDEGNETKQEKQERLRQEALQREQYLLSMRPNRHIVFAAKFAKIKNQGLARRYENQVHTWSQEMDRNFRITSTHTKALQKELVRLRNREGRGTIPQLKLSSSNKKFLKYSPKRRSKQSDLKLPKLERFKDESNRAGHVSDKSNRHYALGKAEFSDQSVMLPSLETAQPQKDAA